jgi:cation diffusion facilitator family transporter
MPGASATTAKTSPAQAIGVALLANLLLAAGKIAYGQRVGSIGLRADGFHNLVDAVGSVVALLAATFAAQPPDSDHPYGHRRIELLGALAVGVFIAAGALQIGWSGLMALVHGGDSPHADAVGMIGVLLSAGVAFAVSTWENRTAARDGNLLIEADVRHQRLDVVGTVGVTAGLLLSRLGFSIADPLAALLVLGVVGYGALGVLTRSAIALSDAIQIDPEKVREEVRAIPEIRGCHKIRSRGAPGAIYVDLHIQVDPAMPIVRAHALGHQLKARVEERIPGVVDVLVHVEPDEPDDSNAD